MTTLVEMKITARVAERFRPEFTRFRDEATRIRMDATRPQEAKIISPAA